MKHLFLGIVFFLILKANAQLTHGFEIGANIMTADFTIDEQELDTKNAFGPRAGYILEFELNKNLYATSGLLFMQKGFKFADETWAISSFDIPINVGYYIPLGKGRMELFFDAGASIEYNVNANTKIDEDIVELIIGNEEGELKSFSSGVSFGTGISLSRIFKLRVNYYKGLTNLINTSSTNQWKNQYLGISLQFLFKNNSI